MKTKSIVKKYEKLSGEYGKAVTKWVEAFEVYDSNPTEETKRLYAETADELSSARDKFNSFAEQEWW